jgi:hypothetical protein
MERAAVDLIPFAMETASTIRRQSSRNASLPPSGHSLNLPMRSLTHDIEIAKAELTDIISDSRRMGTLVASEETCPSQGVSNKRKIVDSVARKRKTKQHNSDDEGNDEGMYDSNHPREEMHKRVKIGDGAIISKEKKGI